MKRYILQNHWVKTHFSRIYNICSTIFKQTHCGVGETIFAPDTETGIASQPDQDPWKWAQDTADIIEKEDGHLVFIGGPPTGMGITIYKDFPNNQAFISTKILKDMVRLNVCPFVMVCNLCVQFIINSIHLY